MGILNRKIAVFMIALLSITMACNKTISVTIACQHDADVDSEPKPLQFFTVGTEEDDIASTLVVTDEHIFVAGMINGSLEYLPENDLNDVALFKLDKEGNTEEFSQFGSDQKDYIHTMIYSQDEQLILAGWDESPDGGTRIGEPRDSKPFVMKRDEDCSEIWKQSFGTETNDYASAVVERDDGKILISGFTYGDFNDETVVNTVANLFVVTTDSQGEQERVTQWGTDANDWVFDATLSGEDLFVVGATDGVFDDNTSAGATDAFISKINASGAVEWTHQFGSVMSDAILAISIDAVGDIFVVGQSYGVFDEGETEGNSHAFIASFDNAGVRKWLHVLSYDAPNVGYDIALSGDTVVIAGLTLGSLFEQPFQGESDMMMAGYSKAGEHLFYWQEGGAGKDAIFSLEIDGDDFYAAGWSEGIPSREVVTKKMDMIVVSGGIFTLYED